MIFRSGPQSWTAVWTAHESSGRGVGFRSVHGQKDAGIQKQNHGRGFVASNYRFILLNPPLHDRLRKVAHGHRYGGPQHQLPVPFFDDHQGIQVRSESGLLGNVRVVGEGWWGGVGG